jgi:hypothetical protein
MRRWLLHEHFQRFVLEYEERFQHDYGFFRPVISDVVQNFLKCGDLKQGFVECEAKAAPDSQRLAY